MTAARQARTFPLKNMSLDQFIWKTLKLRLNQVQYYLKLATFKAEENPEYVHQIRVWSRRTFAACQLFQSRLPEEEFTWITDQMKQIRKAADTARDCDVLLERFGKLPDSTIKTKVIDQIMETRQAAQRPIDMVYQKLIVSGKLKNHIKNLKRHFKNTTNDKQLTPGKFHTWTGKRLRPLVKKFNKATRKDLSVTSNLHHLRIKGKQLRYTFELVAPTLSESQNKKLTREFKKLQKQLGQINDLYSAALSFREWADKSSKPRVIYYLTNLETQELASAEEKRLKFLKQWPPERLSKLAAQFSKLTI